jgi:hypothetical protein
VVLLVHLGTYTSWNGDEYQACRSSALKTPSEGRKYIESGSAGMRMPDRCGPCLIRGYVSAQINAEGMLVTSAKLDR